MRFLIIFLALCTLELWTLVEVSGAIGALVAVLLVLGTAVVGWQLVRFQGIGLIRKIISARRNRETPTKTIIEGVLLIVGGVFLLFPGFITDSIGFLMMIPFVRSRIANLLARSDARQGFSVIDIDADEI